MPRPERPLDPHAGPIQAFAAQLRALRHTAGSPKYQQMARRTGRSRTALTEAAGGNHLPTWETVEAYVLACDGDVQWWRKQYDQARHAIDSAEPQIRPPSAQEAPLPEDDTELPSHSPPVAAAGKSKHIALAAGLILLALVSVIVVTRHTHEDRATAAAAVLHIQNKVAIGETDLVEDSTPVYLSSRPEAFCARRGCRVASSNLWSGGLVVATCHRLGEEMTNADLSSTGIGRNPARAKSALWYHVTLQPNAISGYISEVYVVASDRGGLDLPRCQ